MTGFWVEYGSLTRKKKIRWTKEKLSEFKQPVTNFYLIISHAVEFLYGLRFVDSIPAPLN